MIIELLFAVAGALGGCVFGYVYGTISFEREVNRELAALFRTKEDV